ncbi:DUF5134 domain-containing protein [Streptomyces sp. NPDC006288]|uniref:DUF5134 domain-containing protein n=1 Tax=Streptomyces sp. NPDC006288 TaxID=3156743 RepID=UPI0033AD1270
MHGPALSGWLLMVLCGLTGAYCLLRTRSGTERERGAARSEALMGFGMAAMAVPAALFTPPRWTWAVYAVVFGASSLRALTRVRGGGHHPHHLVGSLAMLYMAVVMVQGAAHTVAGAHSGHGAGPAGGVPVLTGALLVYYALYALRSAGHLVPAPAPVAVADGGTVGVVAWGARPELALGCRLTMAMAMFTMLLTL